MFSSVRLRCLEYASLAAFFLFMTIYTPSAKAAAGGEPIVNVSSARVSVSNITSGGTVILFAGAQQRGEMIQLMRWQRALADTDSDGAVEMHVPDGVPTNSVWIAVDATSGNLAIAAPADSGFRRVAMPSAVLPKGPDGKMERYVTGRQRIDVLVVRPHVGAWVAFAADGGVDDGDGVENGLTTILFDATRSLIGRAPAPHHLTPRDVVVIVDVRRLEYSVTEVRE
jgi:hypothetical protein